MLTKLPTLATLSLCALWLASSACGDREAGPGQLDLALVAPGSDGRLYRLPAGSYLALVNDVFYDTFSLDGDALSVRIEVPAGDYAAILSHPAGYTANWLLDRQRPDGTFETVHATLVSPMPTDVTIIQDAVSTLVLSFRVADGGTVTFQHGALDVVLDVTQTTSTNAVVHLEGTVTVTLTETYSLAPPELIARLPAVHDSGLAAIVNGNLAGPWTQTSDTQVCAPFEVTSWAAGPHPGFADLVSESIGPAKFCVTAGDTPQISVTLLHQGAPSTPTFDDLGASELLFMAVLAVDFPLAVFDGRTLDLGALSGSYAVPASVFTGVSDPSASFVRWYAANAFGNGFIIFTPVE